jgi:VanZ family protein
LGSTIPIWRQPHLIYYWAPPILWGLAVLGMAGNVGSAGNTWQLIKWLLSWVIVLKPAQLSLINYYFRKTGHALAYGFMYFLWFRAFQGYAGAGRGGAGLSSLGLCLYVALLQEGLRVLTLTRGISMHDIIFYLSGASLAALVTASVWRPRRPALPLAGIPGRQTRQPE